MPGLYFHIPFCKQACHYCDFHFSTNLSRISDLVDAIVKELLLQKEYLADKKINSIYFGGGTPSILEQQHLDKIFEQIHNLYKLDTSCEITLEANPDDLTKTKVAALIKSGINRLSIGIQSFDDPVLKFLNRAHNAEMALSALDNVRNAGFKNISLDLIYAIPGQDHDAVKKNIEMAMRFTPEHLSAYSLTIEPKTVFGNWSLKDKLTPVDEAINAEQFEIISSHLIGYGYEHYEISNYCKPEYYSKHNSSYWKQEPYLGIGPSAHSYNKESRQFNISNNASYLKSIAQNKVPYQRETLTRENMINEFVFTTLRTIWGCDLNKLQDEYQFNLHDHRKKYLEELMANELVTLNNQVLRLTQKGKLLADQISLDLML
ncbi:MAG TPA: coproporphyrinogen III oxidase [Cytophagales bacterium]|nr:coproporphyrinogen III oxidase [Cytophagales bacterium]HCR53048.1 coproporphyrinogen III oxidase [Cytophagales bacterium]